MSKFLLFKLSDNLHGINIEEINQVYDLTKITPLPKTPSEIKGVVSILGDITTVIDTGKCLYNISTNLEEENEKRKLITLPNSRCLLIDEVLNIVDVDDEEIKELNKNKTLNCSFGKSNDLLFSIIKTEDILKKIAV